MSSDDTFSTFNLTPFGGTGLSVPPYADVDAMYEQILIGMSKLTIRDNDISNLPIDSEFNAGVIEKIHIVKSPNFIQKIKNIQKKHAQVEEEKYYIEICWRTINVDV